MSGVSDKVSLLELDKDEWTRLLTSRNFVCLKHGFVSMNRECFDLVLQSDNIYFHLEIKDLMFEFYE